MVDRIGKQGGQSGNCPVERFPVTCFDCHKGRHEVVSRQILLRKLPLVKHSSSGQYDRCPGIRLAFEFLVLTTTRSGEVRNARWREIDRDGAVWTIPAARMKNGRELMGGWAAYVA